MNKKKFNGSFSCKKDIGKVRVTNEDETKVLINSAGNVLLMVADGMGGHNKGDYASKETIEIISQTFKDKKGFISLFDAVSWLKKITKLANNRIYKIQDEDLMYKGMGTTLSLVLIYKNKLISLSCGDSRTYWVKDGKLMQISEDQTYVNFLLKSGQITKEEALVHPERHVLTNAIGLFPSISIDIKILKYNGETVFLCSDGLYNNVSEKDILNILNTNLNTEEKVESLINLGNFNGGSDNMSIALWESLDD